MLNKLPLVSIIIPTHNRQEYLRDAIDSAIAQTYPNLEIIVVVDGSVDCTEDLLKNYQGKLTAVTQQNLGVSAARNMGLEIAKGEYISFLDDDDILLPQKIEKQVQWLMAHPSYKWVHCRYFLMDQEGRFLEKIGLLPQGMIKPILLSQNFIWVGAPLIERSLLLCAGSFSHHYTVAADYDLWLRISNCTEYLGCIQEPLGAYRLHKTSMIKNTEKLEQEIFLILDRQLKTQSEQNYSLRLINNVYSAWWLWLSLRYLDSSGLNNAQKCIKMMLTYEPQLLNDLRPYLRRAAQEANDWRVEKKDQFIENIQNALPHKGLGELERQYFLCWYYLQRAIRLLQEGDIQFSTRCFSEAQSNSKDHHQLIEFFSGAIVHACLTSPTQPLESMEYIYENFPKAIDRKFLPSRRSVQGKILTGMAFDDFHNHNNLSALQRSSQAIIQYPKVLANWGFVSMVSRVLVARIRGK